MRHTSPDIVARMAAEIRVHGDSFAALFAAGFSGAEIADHYDTAKAVARPRRTFEDAPHDAVNLAAAVGRASALAMMGTLLASCEFPRQNGSAAEPIRAIEPAEA